MALWITNKQTINDNKTINENNNERKSLKEIRNINITTSKYFVKIFWRLQSSVGFHFDAKLCNSQTFKPPVTKSNARHFLETC